VVVPPAGVAGEQIDATYLRHFRHGVSVSLSFGEHGLFSVGLEGLTGGIVACRVDPGNISLVID
jgi:hypothetical protein